MKCILCRLRRVPHVPPAEYVVSGMSVCDGHARVAGMSSDVRSALGLLTAKMDEALDALSWEK